MLWVWAILAVLVLVLMGAFVCFRLAFYVAPSQREKLLPLPASEQYAPFTELSAHMLRDALRIPYEDVYTFSREGLRLHGKYYAGAPGAPIQIMFHGYRSSAERDFCGGLQVALQGGFHVLLVDQRAHGKSEGHCLTFGIQERFDCLQWVEYAKERFGQNCKIILYGMSMGAATVLMASGLTLPVQVAGIVADCGYTSPAAIIQKVLREKHLPDFPTYALVRLGGRLFGGFDLEAASASDALENCRVPVLLVHGGDDRFVPCAMGEENYRHCAAAYKRLLIVPRAGHGISFLLDRKAYLQELSEFLEAALGQHFTLNWSMEGLK